MDLTVEEFIDGLFAEESYEEPSDAEPVEELNLPPWYEEKKFKDGQSFFWKHSFALASSMVVGLIAVLAVPSILRVLEGSQRSSSVYTAYKRYVSTKLHVLSWYENDLKPGSKSWRSLHAVRTRHFKASVSSRKKQIGTVSQRDLALTQFGFMGFPVLKPDVFGVEQLNPGDWESYTFFWRTIGYMIGIKDKYNICRNTFEETRQVCQVIMDKVFTPGLENVPEYFEHMSRVLLDGLWSINPTLQPDAYIYLTKYLADVPGFIYTENERIEFVEKLKKQLKGKPDDVGVDSLTLIQPTIIGGLPPSPPRLHYVKDYELLTQIPEYKKLSSFSKFKLGSSIWIFKLCSTYFGRLYFNFQYRYSLLLIKYFPYLAFLRFGIIQSYVNMFKESPKDWTKALPNSEYYKPKVYVPWYKWFLSSFRSFKNFMWNYKS